MATTRTMGTSAPAPLAEVVRGDLVESVHAGHLVALDAAGEPVLVAGDPAVTFWPRSSLKPVQALALVRAGLDVPDRLLALACASHAGDAVHRDGVHELLGLAGLDEAALRNTPALPLDPAVALEWELAGHGPSRLTQNCSGKHAAMLVTCRVNGWDTSTYLDPAHPLQQAVAATVRELTAPDDAAGGAGEEPGAAHVTVDGCGAPLFSTSVVGLARAFARIGRAVERDPLTPEARVARAMNQHPHMVSGTGRDATVVMQAVDGLIAKDGADGVFALATADGRAVAFKVADGAKRPVHAVLDAALRALGIGTDDPGAAGPRHPVLPLLPPVVVEGGGAGVGEVRAVVGGTGA
ncbi:asparaginase [Luteimicrobium sp. NPDC057192]|uniref:asparaginase n=1 Tax=Luteimicrobium sp. NPDC057192 TaxID=3346042 RepID=UPI0036282A7F